LTYTDTTVVGLNPYSYTVDAFDAAGNHSAKSAPFNTNTPDSTPPSIPLGLTGTATKTPEVDLSWSASTDNVGVTGYTVYRGGTMLTTVSGTTLTYADKAVVQTTTYSYTVDAFDAAGNHSAQSSAAVATTPDITPPSVPTGLSAAATAGPSVTLNWTPSTDNVGVTGYTIYKGGSFLTTVAATSYVDNAVVSGGSYTYTVDAFDAAGNHSAKSAPATVNSPDTTPPTVPSGISMLTSPAPSVSLQRQRRGYRLHDLPRRHGAHNRFSFHTGLHRRVHRPLDLIHVCDRRF
jgi:chitinase